MNTLHNWDTWIGTDEAGKGDYFGPLVVAAVSVDAEWRETCSDLGIADGKTLSNRRIRNLAELLYHRYEQNIVVVERMPNEYNSLYTEFRRRGQNLNHLLASLHAEAIHTLAARVDVQHVLVDRFSKDDLITSSLRHRMKQSPRWQQSPSDSLQGDSSRSVCSGLEIRQVPKAERDIAVAAASIIARDAFLNAMETLSKKYEIRLPRGAYQVVEAGREFVAVHGSKALGHVAKLHFRLTDVVLGSETGNLF